MSRWSIPIAKIAAQAAESMETVIRKATVDAFTAIVRKSPVGNPDLWKANAAKVQKRQNYNSFVDAINDISQSDPGVGDLLKERSGGRSLKRKSPASLKRMFPNVAGKGYVGGRFRANWNVSYGRMDESTTESVQISRALSEVAKAKTLPVGGIMYMTNALPYARRLEYEGWSKQAPAGMVRITAMEFKNFVEAATKK